MRGSGEGGGRGLKQGAADCIMRGCGSEVVLRPLLDPFGRCVVLTGTCVQVQVQVHDGRGGEVGSNRAQLIVS